MNGVCLIFPHQLFRDHPFIRKGLPVILVEEGLFFRQYSFHCKKLILHRATMKGYEAWLNNEGAQVRYVESGSETSDCRVLVAALAREGIDQLFVADVADDWLRRRLAAAAKQHGLVLKTAPSPNFLNTVEETAGLFQGKNKYFQTDFYIRQRKSRRLLLDANGRPLGGKWSFDADNRKKWPRGEALPSLPLPTPGPFVEEARKYVAANFTGCQGQDDGVYLFGTSFEEADRWLDEFIASRLEKFGVYEDAMVAGEAVLFHSALTPMLNIGLLDPRTVIKKVLKAATVHSLPLNSVEGFVRQVLGWREFIHLVYEREGRFQRTRNFWQFSRKIPKGFYTGETGIEPVDGIIKKVLKNGYCHHIERLMVLGNFMLLCEFHPDEVYRWFMELFIDAYDWVMVPNVYGMTQFADGGLMTTKPYISGSAYLMRMGNFPVGPWQQIWDGLFWRFMDSHRGQLGGNQRLGLLLHSFDRMSAEKRAAHLSVAEDFLHRLDRS